MTSTTFFIIFIPILAVLLLAINLILAPHNPYQEKDSAFECGFHSFLGQNRTQFSVSFFIFALLFLLFDLEILLVYPYSVSSYTNDIYGLVIMMVFFVLLTLGFIFELGKNALTIDSRQTSSYSSVDTSTPHVFLTENNVLLKSSVLSTIANYIAPIIYVSISIKSKKFLVPVSVTEVTTFEMDLSKPIYKCNPVSNNEENSLLAIEKAMHLFKQSPLCACDLRGSSKSIYGQKDEKPIIYIDLNKGDELILVPVLCKQALDFEQDLSEPMYKCSPVSNNEEYSLLAIEKAKIIINQGELCVCELKQF
jgi:NADH-ubiquinone oxidoreductase chain 3